MRKNLKNTTYTFSVLLGVVSLVFFLFTVLPGDPARMMLDQREDSETLEAVRKKHGFNLPIYQQYLWFLNDLSPIGWHSSDPEHVSAHQNRPVLVVFYKASSGHFLLKWPHLRESFQQQGQRVNSIIGRVLPNTIILALAAMTLALILGITLGVISSIRPGSILDHTITLVSTLGMSVPSFLSAIAIAYLFGFLWSSYTGLPMNGTLVEWDDWGESKRIAWENLILPAFTLGIRPLAVITQLTRSSMLEVWQQDYMRTARAKGLTLRQQALRHALPNALNPVITSASGWLASMLAGAVFVEYIFGWNGLGKLIVEALDTLDLPVVMGCVLIIATFFVFINFAVDIIHAKLDPRIKEKQ
ncbi:MAG: ABC transporter permease [Cryomorphaceae bacterium]|nr:ABC transporter permease [Cryomorphaceae bacterium]